MPLFRYPKARYIRNFSPPHRKSYRSHKSVLRHEFNNTCVYCRLTDTLKGDDNFGVDHYRPKSIFPDLISEYSNLFYACNCCNRRKGNYWPDLQLGTQHVIPNPCDHVMFDHLRYDKAHVQGRSETGNIAIETLDLNDANSIDYRKIVLTIVESLKEDVRLHQNNISRLSKLILNCGEENERQELKDKKTVYKTKFSRIAKLLKGILGE